MSGEKQMTEKEKAEAPMRECVKDWKDRGYKILSVNLPIAGSGGISSRFLESMLSMCAGDAYNWMLARKIKMMVNINADFPIDSNRNRGITRALDLLGADYILTLDTDQSFNQTTIMHLLETLEKPAPDGSEVEIACGMYYLKKVPFRPVVGRYTDMTPEMKKNLPFLAQHGMTCRGECGDERHPKGKTHQVIRWMPPHYWDGDEPFRVDVIGVGCSLSRASMWRKMKAPWFKYLPDPMRPEENGAPAISEDMFWCAQMHRAGIKIWCDPRVQCGHIGTLEVTKDHYASAFSSSVEAMESLPEDDPARKHFFSVLADYRKPKVEA